MNDIDELELLPDIDSYLKDNNDRADIIIKDHDELIFKIKAFTGLNETQIKIILKNYFQEIRSEVLRGSTVTVGNLGRMLVSNPNKDTKRKIFINFKSSKVLLDKLNGRRD